MKNPKVYRVSKSLPDGSGAVMISGTCYQAGEMLPSDLPQDRLEDCLKRGLIEECGNVIVPKKVKSKPNPEWTKRLKPVSKWNLNPADLCGKTLKQLNIMILNIDRDAEPFSSMEEALAALTKDYEE